MEEGQSLLTKGSRAENKDLEIIHTEVVLETAVWNKLPTEKIFVRRRPRSDFYRVATRKGREGTQVIK